MELMLVQMGADHAQAAGVVGRAEAHLMLLRHIVEVEPLAVASGHNALGTDDLAVVAAIQRREDLVELRLGEGLHRFLAPGGEHLVGVVMMVMLMVTAMVVFVFVVAALMVMVVMMMFFMVVIVIMVIVMMAAMPVVVMVVMVVVVMMFVFMLVGLMLGAHLLQHLVGQRHLFHGGQNGLAVDLIPGGGDDGGGGVLLPQQGGSRLQLCLLYTSPSPRDRG